MRDVDKDGEAIFRYWRIVLHDELEVFDRFQLVALEEGGMCLRVANEMFYGCGVSAGFAMRGGGVLPSCRICVLP